jgi:cbb3-type cytochrome oxidase subunit 1
MLKMATWVVTTMLFNYIHKTKYICQSFNIFYTCNAMAKVVRRITIPNTEIHLKSISKYSNWRKSHVTCFWYLHDIKLHWNLQSFFKSHSYYQLNTCNPPTTNTTLLLETSSSNNKVLQFTTLNPTLPYLWHLNPQIRVLIHVTLTLFKIT